MVIGSKQMVVFEDTRPDNKLILYDKRIEWKDGVIEGAKPQGVPVPFDRPGAAAPRMPALYRLRHPIAARPLTPGEEGVDVLQVLQACQRSLANERRAGAGGFRRRCKMP